MGAVFAQQKPSEVNEQLARLPLLRGVPIVIPQHATQPLTTLDFAGYCADFVTRFDNPIAQSLVISLSVIVLNVRGDRSP